jgi:hypothetical protein
VRLTNNNVTAIEPEADCGETRWLCGKPLNQVIGAVQHSGNGGRIGFPAPTTAINMHGRPDITHLHNSPQPKYLHCQAVVHPWKIHPYYQFKSTLMK